MRKTVAAVAIVIGVGLFIYGITGPPRPRGRPIAGRSYGGSSAVFDLNQQSRVIMAIGAMMAISGGLLLRR